MMIPDQQPHEDHAPQRLPRAESPPEAFRVAAQQFLARHGWSSVSEEEVCAQYGAHAADPARRPVQLLIHICAAAALHSACGAADDPSRLDRAYTDLHRYLAQIAARRWPEQAPDIVQRALELSYRELAHCRSPETFLTFARYKLMQAAKEQLGAYPAPLSLEDEAGAERLAAATDLAAEVVGMAQLEALMEAIAALPDPRQRAVILRKFFLRHSDQQIANDLGITAAHVAVLRNRGLRRLRESPRLRAVVFPDEPN
jgi:RNA polymerase sigma factor (sigma-70 family)